jgi:AraC-like DNA-binding protein
MVNEYENLNIENSLDGRLWQYNEQSRSDIWRPHTHRELELNLVTKGIGNYIVNNASYSLGPGTLLWLFPGQRHVLMDCSPQLEMWIAVFRPELVNRFCTNSACVLTSINQRKVFIGIILPLEMHYINNIIIDISESQHDKEYINSGLGYLLRRTWSAFEKSTNAIGKEYLHPAVVRMMGLMSLSKLDEPLSDLAEQSGLSHSRLSRIFKEQTTQSLSEFRDRIRLERFCRIYQDKSNINMLDCAYEAGFGSYAQFYRIFKKHLLINPANYWKKNNSC